MGEGGETSGRFPLGFCIASTACTSLGLVAAVGNVQWGVAAGKDAIGFAWIYVNVLLMIGWLVLWPAMCRKKTGGALDRQWGAMILGAIPAMAVAAYLSAAGGGAIFAASLLHVTVALFAWGVLSVSQRKPAAATLLPILALAMPVAAFIAGDTLPRAWRSLDLFAPPIAVAQAARITSGPSASLYAVASVYAVIGLACGTVANYAFKKPA